MDPMIQSSINTVAELAKQDFTTVVATVKLNEEAATKRLDKLEANSLLAETHIVAHEGKIE